MLQEPFRRRQEHKNKNWSTGRDPHLIKPAKLVRQNWNKSEAETWKLKAAEHGVVTSFFYSTSFEYLQIV